MNCRRVAWLRLCAIIALPSWLFLSPVSLARSLDQSGAAPKPAAGILAGRVVDAAGAPVAAAMVMVRSNAPGRPAPAVRGAGPAVGDRVLTDDNGRFVFSQIAAGSYLLDASKPGWLPGAFGRRRPGGVGTRVDLTDNQRRNDVTITLWRAAVIGGRVTDDNGDPLIGVEVRAVRRVFIAGRRQSETPIRAKTDDLGAYRFSGLMPGDYLVAVLASVLSEPAGFAGAIRAGGGTPRPYLQTMTAMGTAPIVFDRATGVAGSARPLVGSLSPLPGVPAEGAPWPAYPTTFHPAVTAMTSATLVRVASGDVRSEIDVSVRLTPTWEVSGTLRDADGPASWHAVHLVPAESGDTPLVDVSTAVTDATGAFTFYGVPPGQFIARVVRTPWPSGQGQGLGIAGGTGQIPFVATFAGSPNAGPPTFAEPLFHASQTVAVVDRHIRDLSMVMREGPRVRGRARFEGSAPQPTTEQLAAARVIMEPANGRVDSAVWPGPLSGDGQFITPSLWPGRYLIRATAPPGWTFKDATYQGRDVSESPIEITTDLDSVVITFTDQPRTIKGTVQGASGQPVDGSFVLLFPADAAGWVDYGRTSRRVTSAPVSATGEFTLSLPPAGDYCLIAIPDDLSDGWQNPEILAKLSGLAERVRVGGDVSITQSLQIRRFQ